jgi:hypothetical protein
VLHGRAGRPRRGRGLGLLLRLGFVYMGLIGVRNIEEVGLIRRGMG